MIATGGALAIATAIFLTAPATPADAAWPGTNGKIYFACRAPATGTAGQDICSVNPDGTGLKNLTNTPAESESLPSASRDGAKIAFIRGSGATARVWVMNADGSGQKQITDISSDGPTWTPDGKLSYRARTGESTFEFRVTSLSGETVKLRDAIGTDKPARFNAAGDWLFTSYAPIPPENRVFRGEIFVVRKGFAPQMIARQGAAADSTYANDYASWAPDGSKIIYMRVNAKGAGNLYTVSAVGGPETTITSSVLPYNDSWASFSPDGTKIVYQRQSPNHDFFNTELVVAKADGTDPKPIALDPTVIKWAGTPDWGRTEDNVEPPANSTFTATAPTKVKQGKALKVTLRCLGGTGCKVTYGAKITVPRKGKAALSYTVKAATVSMRPDSSKTVSVQPSKAATKAIKTSLKAKQKPSITVTATAKNPGGKLIRTVKLEALFTK